MFEYHDRFLFFVSAYQRTSTKYAIVWKQNAGNRLNNRFWICISSIPIICHQSIASNWYYDPVYWLNQYLNQFVSVQCFVYIIFELVQCKFNTTSIWLQLNFNIAPSNHRQRTDSRFSILFLLRFELVQIWFVIKISIFDWFSLRVN